ncbi:hypothetical protein NEOC65_002415 [Neochlamydia sp. AcF65]|nr:hypothetical protein [Neochlamydia sp. AcF65]
MILNKPTSFFARLKVKGILVAFSYIFYLLPIELSTKKAKNMHKS